MGLLILGSVSACKGEKASPLYEAAQAHHGSELSHPIPIFSVADLRASQRYYRDVLGFKLAWEDGDPADFGAVVRSDATLFLCQGCQGRSGAWVMIFSRDVDELHRELKAKGARVKQVPTLMPWKLREMHVADPDGNVMRFASTTEH